jgi:hypothetical protein
MTPIFPYIRQRLHPLATATLLATGPDAIERAIRFPARLSIVFELFGFTCVILGVMAYFTAHHGDPRRKWGLWLGCTGSIMAIVGLRPDILLSLLKYMIPN